MPDTFNRRPRSVLLASLVMAAVQLSAPSADAGSAGQWRAGCNKRNAACEIRYSDGHFTVYEACTAGKCYRISCQIRGYTSPCTTELLVGVKPKPKTIQAYFADLI